MPESFVRPNTYDQQKRNAIDLERGLPSERDDRRRNNRIHSVDEMSNMEIAVVLVAGVVCCALSILYLTGVL